MAKSQKSSRLSADDRSRFDNLIEANPEALLADGLEAAYIGHTVNQHHAIVAVYDYAKCANVPCAS